MTSKQLKHLGQIITVVCVLILLVDAIGKILGIPQIIDVYKEIEFPLKYVPFLGYLLLVCVILYLIPKTSFLGAILLTGYLGGAISAHLRVDNPLFTKTLVPLYIGVFLWTGFCLINFKNIQLLINKKRED